jgi:exodeoxyribonuclease-3
MKIATWNVNSVRSRLEHVVNWLTANPVDVLCLQETKVVDDKFPREPLAELGYHLSVFGQPSYNGVAILSRKPLSDVSRGFEAIVGEDGAEFDAQKRVITGIIGDLRVVNLYVPNGSSLGSDKYQYKLKWLDRLHNYLKALLQEPNHLLVCGDFNIALEDIDIHDPTGREKEVMATDAERQALRVILDLGLADVFRKFQPEGGNFSWWDYRAGSFRRNAGWRIDHIYLTPEVYEKATACTIDTTPRKLEKPSDHTPVIVELDSLN